jgi:hypothetical protein
MGGSSQLLVDNHTQYRRSRAKTHLEVRINSTIPVTP